MLEHFSNKAMSSAITADLSGRRTETKHEKAERMAAMIVEITRERGACTDDDLYQAAFTEDEIRSVGPLAKQFAAMTLQASAK